MRDQLLKQATGRTGVKLWRGATPKTATSQIAIQERHATGEVIDWLEKVNDAHISPAPGPRDLVGAEA